MWSRMLRHGPETGWLVRLTGIEHVLCGPSATIAGPADGLDIEGSGVVAMVIFRCSQIAVGASESSWRRQQARLYRRGYLTPGIDLPLHGLIEAVITM